MKSGAKLLKQLEDTSKRVGDSFKGASVGGYIASAVYVASESSPDSVFAVTHSGGSAEHFARTDKYVHLRKFNTEHSIAAQVFTQKGISVHPSRMFPNEHLCVNIPVTPQGRLGAEPDRNLRGMLQVVFDAQSELKLNDLKSHINAQPDYRAMSGILTPLLENIDGARDVFFKVREPYQANAVVMFYDISDFSGHSNKLGAYRAQDFADKFCQEFMKPLSNEFGANLLRYEGDGIWLEMPVDQYSNDEERLQKIEHALNMAKRATSDFSDFAVDQDYSFKNAKLKVSMELGEVRDYYWDRHNILQHKVDDRSGPVFTDIRKADKSVARRVHHDIVIGPELKAKLSDTSIYKIPRDDFEHYTP